MNFDPQKFFIDLMDFFSILLTDALLTWLLMGDMYKTFLICHQSDRMTNPLPNHLHIHGQVERCPGALMKGRIEKIGGRSYV